MKGSHRKNFFKWVAEQKCLRSPDLRSTQSLQSYTAC